MARTTGSGTPTHRRRATGDPKLLDMHGKDFRLRSDSPLRGVGQNLSKHYQTDFAGNPLQKTGAWDIGAFSYGKIDSSAGGHNQKPYDPDNRQ